MYSWLVMDLAFRWKANRFRDKNYEQNAAPARPSIVLARTIDVLAEQPRHRGSQTAGRSSSRRARSVLDSQSGQGAAQADFTSYADGRESYSTG